MLFYEYICLTTQSRGPPWEHCIQVLHPARRSLILVVMPLKRALQFNIAWSVLMALAYLLFLVGAPSTPRILVFAVSLLFVMVSISASRLQRWSVITVVLVAVALVIRWLPMVLLNFYMFLTDHALYRDSPATIIVVANYALVFAIPALIIVAMYIIQWRALVSVAANRATGP